MAARRESAEVSVVAESLKKGVPHNPEYEGIYVDRHGGAGERRFGGDAGDAHALIHEAAQRIHDGNDVEHAWTAQSDIAAQPQHRDFLPLVGHPDGEHEVDPDGAGHQRGYGTVGGGSRDDSGHDANDAERGAYAADGHFLALFEPFLSS